MFYPEICFVIPSYAQCYKPTYKVGLRQSGGAFFTNQLFQDCPNSIESLEDLPVVRMLNVVLDFQDRIIYIICLE